MRAYYSRVPLRTQSQIDQAIKNYLEIPDSKKPTQVLISFGGGTGIYLRIGKKTLSTFVRFGQRATNIYLGNYYSEELDTDPSVYYPYLTYYAFTYEELIKRGEYARIHGAPRRRKLSWKQLKRLSPWKNPVNIMNLLCFQKFVRHNAARTPMRDEKSSKPGSECSTSRSSAKRFSLS